MITLALPWPPSVNHYWRTVQGRTIISADGRRYTKAVQGCLLEQLRRIPRLARRLSVTVEACPPDNRRRDLDNILKALLDSCTKAGLWQDDSQIDDLRIVRKSVTPKGSVTITVEEPWTE